MQLIKSTLAIAVMSVGPFCSVNAYENVVGISVGSPGYGVNYNRENFRISAGFDVWHASLDLLWNAEWAGLLGGYAYTGAQWTEEPDKEWGVKTGVGIAVPLSGTNAEFYGEYGPVWCGKNGSYIEFEGSFGVRLIL